MKQASKTKNRAFQIVVDVLMSVLLVLQMLYVFTGGTAHELLGIGFFVCLIAHVVQKRWWYKSLFRGGKRSPLRRAFNIVTVLLSLCILLLMLSGIGVSRVLFPKVLILGDAALHRYLATAVLALAVLHGGLHFCLRPGRLRLKLICTLLCAALAVAFGLALVPYMNRHFKTVEIDYARAVTGEKVDWPGKKPLVVYFTRLGNTDFASDVDAVSGASLMLADGQLMGNAQLLADMIVDALDCPAAAITLTGEKYASSYNDTVLQAQRELRQQARPAIAPIDIADADTVILVYPLWWGTLPMPVATFLESADFAGKTVALVATQGSSGFAASAKDIRDLIPGARVEEWISVYCDDIPAARQALGRVLAERAGK